MPAWYIASRRERVTVLRDALYQVWADSEEEAEALLKAGRGDSYAVRWEEETPVEVGEFENVHYDWNEGMGR